MGISLITPGENNQVADDHCWLTLPTGICVCVCVCVYSIWEVTFSIWIKFSSVQFSSVAHHVFLFATPWIAACRASLSITNSQSSLRLMFIESVMPSNHLILCRPLLLLPSIFSSIRVFSNESAFRISWPKYWSFSFISSPSNEYPGLISFRMDWLDLLAVQGTLKGLLQHHSSKAPILRCSAFFTVQLSHPYMTTGKTIALTRWTLVGKVKSLLLNMLSRLVITFLPRSKHLLISWLQSPSTVILEPRKIVWTCSQFPHLFPMKWWDQMPWSFFSECWALNQLFHSSTFTFIQRLFSFSSLSAMRVVSSAYLRWWYLLLFLEIFASSFEWLKSLLELCGNY